MKKYFIASSILIVLIMCSTIVYGDTVNTDNPVSQDNKNIESYDGIDVVHAYDQTTTMVFEGDSKNWSGYYKAVETMNEDGSRSSEVNIKMTPKYESVAQWVQYKITTSNGVVEGSDWLIFGESLELELDEPVPSKDDDIEVRLKVGNLTEIFNLECTIYDVVGPTNNIDNQVDVVKAVKLLLVTYKNIYGEDMPLSYTIYVEFVDGEWVVGYDDNDGVGGKAYLTVNAKDIENLDPSAPQDVKIQE